MESLEYLLLVSRLFEKIEGAAITRTLGQCHHSLRSTASGTKDPRRAEGGSDRRRVIRVFSYYNPPPAGV